jgi:hypothetical protein
MRLTLAIREGQVRCCVIVDVAVDGRYQRHSFSWGYYFLNIVYHMYRFS